MELGIGRGDSSRRVLGKTHDSSKISRIFRIFRNLSWQRLSIWKASPQKFPWTNGEVRASGSPATARKPGAPPDASATA